MKEKDFKSILKEVVSENRSQLTQEIEKKRINYKKSSISSSSQFYALLKGTKLLLECSRVDIKSRS